MVNVRLYQDIDGCLNASWNAKKWRRDSDEDQAGYQRAWAWPAHDDFGVKGQAGGVKYRMEWNDRLIAALNTLDVELVWTTTWREDAREVGAAMGLTHEPQRVLHPPSGRTTFPSLEWKWAAVTQEQSLNPSPFIWVDDELTHLTDYERGISEKMGGLLISPDFNFGITPEHIEQMRQYIDKHTV